MKKSTRSIAHMQGFTLIELMISIVLSMMLILATTMLFLFQSKSFAVQDESSKITENGRFLIQAISRELRLAGYTGPNTTSTTNNFGATESIAGSNDGGINTSDEFTVRYFGGTDSNGNVDNTVVDCLGQTPLSGNAMIVDRFYLATDASNNNEPSLFCNNGTTASPLISGVESMQILYGEDHAGTGSITRYRHAGVANMSFVKGLLISVVLRGETTNNPTALNLTHNHFGLDYAPANAAPVGDAGSVFTAANDKRMRRLITFTVGLRNKLD